jgi:hypothetical protein
VRWVNSASHLCEEQRSWGWGGGLSTAHLCGGKRSLMYSVAPAVHLLGGLRGSARLVLLFCEESSSAGCVMLLTSEEGSTAGL